MHDGQAQLLPLHTPDVQSLPLTQAESGAQALHSLPPQSVSVSTPLWTPSLQLGAAQEPSTHNEELQSAAAPQVLATPQG